MLRYLVLRKFRIIIAETALVVGIVLLACFLPLQSSPLTLPDTFQIIRKALLIAFTFQLFLHLRDVHDTPKACSTSAFAMRLGQALLMGSAVLWTVYFFFPSVEVGRGMFVVTLALSAAFLFGWHVMLRSYFMSRRAHSNVLVLGTGKLARELVREILRKPELGLGVKGFVDDKPELVGVSIVNPCVLGLYQDLPFLVSKHQVDRIVVELQDRRGRLPVSPGLRDTCATPGRGTPSG